MSHEQSDISLSILITVVSGKDAVRRCLRALCPQAPPHETEIIVPYDQWSAEVGDLSIEFPEVCFPFIDDLGAAVSTRASSLQHRLYDRRRAVGLAIARGPLVALTEDHAVPAADWCEQIRAAHCQPYAVIGGAIDNGVDRPLNWALYYCDFGRYGSPLQAGPAQYVSDVNVAYKRAALESVRPVWRDAYHETTVHWALQTRGAAMILDPRMSVRQLRPRLTFGAALRERLEWGRIFAETRAAEGGFWMRVGYALATPILPALLLTRVLRHMRRQRRTVGQTLAVLPVVVCLVVGWAIGECCGYVWGPPSEGRDRAARASEISAISRPIK